MIWTGMLKDALTELEFLGARASACDRIYVDILEVRQIVRHLSRKCGKEIGSDSHAQITYCEMVNLFGT
jgi:hypothetical protein